MSKTHKRKPGAHAASGPVGAQDTSPRPGGVAPTAIASAAASGHPTRGSVTLPSQVPSPRGLGAAPTASTGSTRSRHNAKRAPGGQPGNHNAIKHGFYSATFTERERELISQMPLTDLSPEVDLVRVAILRFSEALKASEAPSDLATNLAVLRAVSRSTQAISSLVRAHKFARAMGQTIASTDAEPGSSDVHPNDEKPLPAGTLKAIDNDIKELSDAAASGVHSPEDIIRSLPKPEE